MLRRLHVLSCLRAALALAVLGGCGGDRGPERVVISGTVACNGKPVAHGMIRFTPVQTANVPTSGAMIVDGRYRADSLGGVPVGTHKIQIEVSGAVPSSLQPDASLPPKSHQDTPVRRYLSKSRDGQTGIEITIPPGSREIAKDFDMVD